jgi:hypothetical protein
VNVASDSENERSRRRTKRKNQIIDDVLIEMKEIKNKRFEMKEKERRERFEMKEKERRERFETK